MTQAGMYDDLQTEVDKSTQKFSGIFFTTSFAHAYAPFIDWFISIPPPQINWLISINFETFDFIPFAFTDGREAFFINDNCLLENLIRTNRNLKRRVDNEMAVSEGKAKDVRRILFKTIQETADFIDYDVKACNKFSPLAITALY